MTEPRINLNFSHWSFNIVIFAIAFVGVTSTIAADNTSCTIAGSDAVNEARAAGFSTAFSKITGSGFCQMGDDDPWFMASASANQEVVCSGLLFAGRELNDNWSFNEAIFIGSPLTDRVNPSSGSKTIAISFKLRADPGKDRKTYLKEVILNGPNCKDWKSAFKASRAAKGTVSTNTDAAQPGAQSEGP